MKTICLWKCVSDFYSKTIRIRPQDDICFDLASSKEGFSIKNCAQSIEQESYSKNS